MSLTIAPTSFDHPGLKKMVADYYDRYHMSYAGYFHNPAQWVGGFSEDTLLAAIGFTRSPDESTVFVSELVCEPNIAGMRALKKVVAAFQTYAADHPKIQTVVAQCLTANKVMQKFLSHSTFMRPVSTVYACAKSDIAEDSDGRRFRL